MKRRRSKKQEAPNAPSRKLVEVSPHRTTGGLQLEELTPFPVEYESPHEKLLVPLLLLCRDIKKIYSQQERTYLDHEGIERKYTADFLVDLDRKDMLLEVKPLKYLLHPEHLPKYLAIARHFRKVKQAFAFVVDAQLFQEPLRSNANLLSRYLTAPNANVALELAHEALRGGPASIAELCDATGRTLAEIYTLIAQRHLCIDWSLKLSKSSLVSLPEQPLKGLLLEDILRSTRHGDLLAALALGRGTPDQYRLADATAWRQARQPITPWSFVGGFSKTTPLRDLGETELRPRKSWERRDRAPGLATKPSDA